MGYVADFVTGRSISEGEPTVGIVIVPRTAGWPDPIMAAAVDPVRRRQPAVSATGRIDRISSRVSSYADYSILSQGSADWTPMS